MESGALSDESFVELTKKFVPFLHVTSQVASDKYQGLLKEKEGRGFPYLVFLDAEGNLLAAHQGPRTVSGFDETGQRVLDWLALKTKVEGGDESAKAALLAAELRLGKVGAEEGKKRLGELQGVSPEARAEIESVLFDVEVMQMARGAGRDQAKIDEAGKTFLEWGRAGKVPTEKGTRQTFWYYALVHAETAKDADAFEFALGKFSETAGADDPRTAKFIEQAREKLKGLRGEK